MNNTKLYEAKVLGLAGKKDFERESPRLEGKHPRPPDAAPPARQKAMQATG
jgi:hypothetical protein